jgi:fructose-1,6-bisphosphatase/inositol monophosphatase family enzyme
MIRSPLMTVMTDAVMKASRSLKRDFGEVENLQVSRKGPGDFVSAADRKAEKILREALEKARPGYGFIMEEEGVVVGTDPSHRWHIDPLDGTTNFLHGLPQFAISVGLERDGQIVAGVIYDPAKDELFIAERGKGAYLNNRRIRVAARTEVPDAVVACGLPHAPLGRCLPRPRLCGLRTLRRLLGARPELLGYRGRHPDDPRGRRLRFRRGRRQRSARQGLDRLRERDHAPRAAQAPEKSQGVRFLFVQVEDGHGRA